jgi:hypothetical protein
MDNKYNNLKRIDELCYNISDVFESFFSKQGVSGNYIHDLDIKDDKLRII